MIQMLCRNRVTDFMVWKAAFDTHADAHEATGLRLLRMWRSVEDPNNVFFLLEVADVDKARDFVTSPDSAKAGEEAGVLDGELHFVEVFEND